MVSTVIGYCVHIHSVRSVWHVKTVGSVACHCRPRTLQCYSLFSNLFSAGLGLVMQGWLAASSFCQDVEKHFYYFAIELRTRCKSGFLDMLFHVYTQAIGM